MDSRKIDQIKSIKSTLDKALIREPRQNEERILDMLKSLHTIEMNSNILRTCDLGPTMKELKKTFGESSIGTEVKKLVVKWKNECSSVTNEVKPSSSKDSNPKVKESSSSNSQAVKPLAAPSPAPITATNMSLLASTSADDEEEASYWNGDEIYTPVSEKRRVVSS